MTTSTNELANGSKATLNETGEICVVYQERGVGVPWHGYYRVRGLTSNKVYHNVARSELTVVE